MSKLSRIAAIRFALIFIAHTEPHAEPAALADNGASHSTLDMLDKHLAPFHVQTTFIGGIATLHGTVNSNVERDLAETIAKNIDGVTEVRNELTVSPKKEERIEPEREPGRKSHDVLSMIGWLHDASITTQIKMRLLWDDSIDGRKIHVHTTSRVVTLSGKVDTAAQAEAATRVAHRSDDIASVVNRIHIKNKASLPAISTAHIPNRTLSPSLHVSDGWIVAKLKSVLMFSDNAGIDHLQIDSRDGIVRLQGEVENEVQKLRAVEAASAIAGVKRVDDNLTVRETKHSQIP